VRGKIANIESTKLNATIREVNRELEAVAKKRGVKFLNIHPLFFDGKGEMKTEYSDDGVHPNRTGYEAWARQIKRFLNK
jgi:lysophospholipase L1-like esterase